MKANNKILIIDGTYLAYKSYYATLYSQGPILMSNSGKQTNEIVAFFNTMIALIDYHNPSHIFIAFDSHVKTFRHLLHKEYKANRKKASSDFYEQLNTIQTLLSHLNIKNFYIDGFEADDIIAKLVNMFANNENKILIYSADQDLNQLVSENVSILKKIKNVNVTITQNNFENYYDFKPCQVIDYKAIVGDTSDNFKGITGIGPKTAIELLSRYETLENIYANLDNLKDSVKQKFITYKDDAMQDKYLATLRVDFDIPLNNLDEILLTNFSLPPKAYEILDKLNLNLIKAKLKKLEVN